MKSRKKDFGGSRDIISGLPDALICHILSFLPTKEAASTTVLAKRWKPLLAFVPNLDFDDSVYLQTQESKSISERYKSFMSFVDSVLALQAKKKTPLKRFRVKCKHVVDQYWVLEWIPKVLKRGVLDIDISIPSSRDYCEDSSFYPLPSKIFVSKTLVRLKIQFQDGISIHVKRLSLPKLKTLHLDYFKIETRAFNKLLSGCYALEELVLVNLMWDESSESEPCPVTVSIPTLKRLKFRRSKDFYEAEFHDADEYFDEEDNKGVSLSFGNPNLVYLEYSDAIVDKYKQVRFDSLVEANLRLRKAPDQSETDKSNVTKLLMGICNVKILYLSDDTLQVLACCRETLPVFDNLMELTIKTTPYVGWKLLPPLLKSCPSLETLVFEGLHHKYTNRCGDKDGCLCKYDDHWGAKMDIRTCLSSSPVKVLKILKFGEIFDDDDDDGADDDDDDEDAGSCDDREVGDVIEDQIKHVEHFLETMPSLEQVILYYNTPKDEDVMKVFKKLEKLPRVASANCSVQLKSNNLSLSSTSTKRSTLL